MDRQTLCDRVHGRGVEGLAGPCDRRVGVRAERRLWPAPDFKVADWARPGLAWHGPLAPRRPGAAWAMGCDGSAVGG